MTSATNIERAFEHASHALLAEREPQGHWIGQLSASALSTATAISAFSFYLQSDCAENAIRKRLEFQVACGLRWLETQQNEDGGWGDTDKSYSNISTTMLVTAAMNAAGVADQYCDAISRAGQYVQSKGGIPGLKKRYGRDKTFSVPILANCAMAGTVDWKEVSALPFEAACVPQKFYNLMQMPVVSYAIPALVAIGQAKFANDPPWNPITRQIRRMCVNRSLNVLNRMQPASGGFLEAVPLTSFVSMGLIKSGRANHPVVKKGLEFILSSFRFESESHELDTAIGSWPIDTNLATWNTTLSLNALASSPGLLQRLYDSDREQFLGCLNWVLDCQYKTVHPFTGAKPGGWGWSDLSGAVPDADDTPGALLALASIYDQVDFDDSVKQKIQSAAAAGVRWLVKLQNRDKGWPTFCRGWGRFPFDRSGQDITAHAIRGLLTWKNKLSSSDFDTKSTTRAIESGFGYLRSRQQNDGSWLPLWFGNQDNADDENPCYGTAKVLMAFRDANLLDTKAARGGLRWLCSNQNEDGGWGGGISVHSGDPTLGQSSVEETALSTEILLGDNDSNSQAAASKGIAWLVKAAESERLGTSTPIGFYFAKLWYYEKLYPLIFATSALAVAQASQNDERVEQATNQITN